MLLGLQHFGGRGACWSFEMGLRRMISTCSLTRIYKNQTTRWLVHSLNTFGAKTSHGQLKIHKIHHGLNLGEAITFPLIVFSAYSLQLSIGATSKWHFALGLPSGNPKIPITGTSTTLGAHNFACRPLIVMRSKAKLQPSLRNFQRYVPHCQHMRKSSQFPTFSGQESNYQFDSQPFSFGHNLCFRCSNG